MDTHDNLKLTALEQRAVVAALTLYKNATATRTVLDEEIVMLIKMIERLGLRFGGDR